MCAPLSDWRRIPVAVRWMVRLIVRGALTGFVYYLLGLGALVIALQVSGKL